MLTLKGTHGTTVERAKQILASGFNPTVKGRAGRGVYFWHYQKDPVIAVDLAIGWYKFQLRTQAYRDEEAPQEAVIFGSFDVPEEDTLDCTSPDVVEDIALSLRNLPTVGDDDIHSAYEMVVAGVEKILGRRLIVIKANVPQPARMPFNLKNVIGNPTVFVVREQIDKICLSSSIKEVRTS